MLGGAGSMRRIFTMLPFAARTLTPILRCEQSVRPRPRGPGFRFATTRARGGGRRAVAGTVHGRVGRISSSSSRRTYGHRCRGDRLRRDAEERGRGPVLRPLLGGLPSLCRQIGRQTALAAVRQAGPRRRDQGGRASRRECELGRRRAPLRAPTPRSSSARSAASRTGPRACPTVTRSRQPGATRTDLSSASPAAAQGRAQDHALRARAEPRRAGRAQPDGSTHRRKTVGP